MNPQQGHVATSHHAINHPQQGQVVNSQQGMMTPRMNPRQGPSQSLVAASATPATRRAPPPTPPAFRLPPTPQVSRVPGTPMTGSNLAVIARTAQSKAMARPASSEVNAPLPV